MDAYREILIRSRVFWIVFIVVGVIVNLVLVGVMIYRHASDPEDAEIRRRARKLAKKRVRASGVRRDEEEIFRSIYADRKKRHRERNRKEWIRVICIDVILAVLGVVLLAIPIWRCTAITLDIKEDTYVSYYGRFKYVNARGGNNVFLTDLGGKRLETGRGIICETAEEGEVPDGEYQGYVVYGRHSGLVVSFEEPAEDVSSGA